LAGAFSVFLKSQSPFQILSWVPGVALAYVLTVGGLALIWRGIGWHVHGMGLHCMLQIVCHRVIACF